MNKFIAHKSKVPWFRRHFIFSTLYVILMLNQRRNIMSRPRIEISFEQKAEQTIDEQICTLLQLICAGSSLRAVMH